MHYVNLPDDYADQLSDAMEDAVDCMPEVWLPIRSAVTALLESWGVHQMHVVLDPDVPEGTAYVVPLLPVPSD